MLLPNIYRMNEGVENNKKEWEGITLDDVRDKRAKNWWNKKPQNETSEPIIDSSMLLKKLNKQIESKHSIPVDIDV